MSSRFLIIVLCCFSTISCHCQTISYEDNVILQKFWQYADSNHLGNKKFSDRVTYIAKFFLKSPYQSHTLDGNNEESLIINLRTFDCVTFVENVLALTYLPTYKQEAYEIYLGNLKKIRYRKGIVDYMSRLHYSTDWLHEMQENKLLKDITYHIGGIPYKKKIDYMSQHINNYPLLESDSSLLNKIRDIENNINQLPHYYINKSELPYFYPKINDGDIILITTTIKGLDTSHIGIALKKGKQIFLLHASSQEKKVVITPFPLHTYMQKIKSQSGIIVGRIP